jgi:putative flavoprotein involved in K+ transport
MVLIIGAGVSGLATAKCLNDRGIGTTLVDRYGEAGGAYRRMYEKIQLTSPASYLRLPGTRDLRGTQYLSAGEYASYIGEYADRNRLRPQRRDVSSVQREGRDFQVSFADQARSEAFSAVVVCTGMFDSPRIPAFPGMPAPGDSRHGLSVTHAADWRGINPSLGSHVVIVGGGVAAVEIAEECVRAGLTPVVSTTSTSIHLLPQRILSIDPRRLTYPLVRRAPRWVIRRQCASGWRHRGVDRGFSEFQRKGLLKVVPTIRAVTERRVTFADGSSVDADAVVLATGYRFDMPFLPKHGLTTAQGAPRLHHGRSTAWPGLFFVGVPCAYTAVSHFVYGIAADAEATAGQIEMATRPQPIRAARPETVRSAD